MSVGSAHLYINALQDPFQGLGVAYSDTVPASIDGQLDPSLFNMAHAFLTTV